MTNHFDNIDININKKHTDINQIIPRHPFGPIEPSHRVIHHLLRSSKLYSKLIDSGFIRRWFSEFNFYWQKELGGRPLKFHDFFYLYSHYRVKFQNIELAEETNSDKFLEDWQKPANIYQIFSCAYQYATNPFSYLPFKKYLKKNDKILEYGAGFAPITTSLVHYHPNKYDLTIADIPQYTFHYAKWKLKLLGIKTIDINPATPPPLAKYDVIFLITVLEHLPNPLEVIKHLTSRLNPDGLLIFDYIKSEAKGLDTKQSLEEREKVISFIKENYKVMRGTLNIKNIKTVIAKK